MEGSNIWITNSTLWSGTKYGGSGCYSGCTSEDLYSDLNIYGSDLEITNSLLHSRTEAPSLNSDYRYYMKTYNDVEISVDNLEIIDSSLTTYSYMNRIQWSNSYRSVYSDIRIEATSFESDNSTIMIEVGSPSDHNSGYIYPDFDIVIEGDNAKFDVTESFVGVEEWTDSYGEEHIYVKETNYTLNILDSEFRTHIYACSHLANLGCNSTYYNSDVNINNLTSFNFSSDKIKAIFL